MRLYDSRHRKDGEQNGNGGSKTDECKREDTGAEEAPEFTSLQFKTADGGTRLLFRKRSEGWLLRQQTWTGEAWGDEICREVDDVKLELRDMETTIADGGRGYSVESQTQRCSHELTGRYGVVDDHGNAVVETRCRDCGALVGGERR